VRASRRSVLALASEIACSSLALATTRRATCGSMIRAMASALPVASKATSSSGARLAAKTSSSSGREATRPAERRHPPSLIATSQKSPCTSMPMARMGALPSLDRHGGAQAGESTPTDSCS
jgi:hypothetical protein